MRSAKHLKFIRSLPCLICGDDTGSDACHVRYSDSFFQKLNPGIGRKPGDEWTVPMCRTHHTAQHEGSETGFWKIMRLNPLTIAKQLFAATGDHAKGCHIVGKANGSIPF
jgi:hypothetical protein